MALSWALHATLVHPGSACAIRSVPASVWNFYQVEFVKNNPSSSGSDAARGEGWSPACLRATHQAAGVRQPLVLVVEGILGA